MRYLTLMEEATGRKGVGAPNVTFGSNRSVKNVEKGRALPWRANESTRVVNSLRRDEISIDLPRGSEIPK